MIYHYKCDSCGEKEVLLNTNLGHESPCPKCGIYGLRRVYSVGIGRVDGAGGSKPKPS